MSSNITLDKKHIVSSNNSVLEYKLPRKLEVNDDNEYKICLTSLSIYLSWFNISSAYNNNKIIYEFWDLNGDLVPFEITIQDGYYSLEGLYFYILKEMYINGHYLENINTDEIMYFFFVKSNATYYSHEFIFYSISSQWEDIDVVWKTPTTWKLPDTYQYISIVLPTYGHINQIFGFEQGKTIMPNQPATNVTVKSEESILSDFAPQIMPSSSYFVLCSLCNNELNEEKRILTTFSIPHNVFFGDPIEVLPNIIYSKVNHGLHDIVRVEILDQNYIPLQIRDPVMVINLSIIKE